MRWKNAAPVKIYIVADNETGDVQYFGTTRQRTDYMVENHPVCSVSRFKFMTYTQQEKK